AEVPCVVVNVQRFGPSTGIPTAPAQGDVMQARWGTHGDHPVIALCPSSVEECYHLAVQAVNFSERYRTPVILLADEVIGHLREPVALPVPGAPPPVGRKNPPAGLKNYLPYRAGDDGVPLPADFGTGYRYHVTGLVHDESGAPTGDPQAAEALIKRLHRKIYGHLDDISLVEEWRTDDAEVIVLAYGAVARPARQAVKSARAGGIRAGLFRPVTLWPFPEKKVAAAAAKARAILVPEMNMGQIVREVERAARGGAKVAGLNRVTGELISPAGILEALKNI
ncbi:MAG: 2-oxoacid:acceptor oxidoreductase subunit alpha, partial [Peptococcaceae bacterium]|nr:2-oxoacid:acceptor oxidoreductase subunit alpha [Peptococcaceae bacterium]